uniref:ABC transmembrane type-1 domain-containing protein n=1 Tax=Ananas comosus var. bracteatus TaxID=296719 RepID=A0A6V7PGG5_ANACO|nr:unnamed protein product [Ananas comosus var. bracteatus]
MEAEKKRGEDRETGNRCEGSLRGVFRFADRVDVLLMFLGTIGAVGDGCSTNCLLLFASNLMNSLGYGKAHQDEHLYFMHEIEKMSLGYMILMRFVLSMINCRGEVGFFDSQEATTAEIINSISKDTSLIQEVLSEKVPIFLVHSSVFISGLAFSTYFSWRLSLAAFPLLLLLVIPGLIYGRYLLFLSQKLRDEYAEANAIVAQALGAIKTVYSFTAERRIVGSYAAVLEKAIGLGVRQGTAKGLAVGFTGLSFAIWGFLAWYGSRLVMFHGESGGRIYAAGIAFVLGGLYV